MDTPSPTDPAAPSPNLPSHTFYFPLPQHPVGDNFVGESEEGVTELVGKVRTAMNVRFPGEDQPDILFTDRGAAFYSPNGGTITAGFKAALAQSDFKSFYGDAGWKQPGKLADVLLHETAVAWIRKKEVTCRMPRPWEETVAQFTARLKQVVKEINDTHDVEGLCRQLPRRLQELVVDRKGDRLKY